MRALKEYIRLHHDNSIAAFARAFGFGANRVGHWLKQRRYPDRKAALLISRRTQIPLDILLGDNHRKQGRKPR